MTADTLTPEQWAAELLARTPHARDCAAVIDWRDKGPPECNCQRTLRAIIEARSVALEEAAALADRRLGLLPTLAPMAAAAVTIALPDAIRSLKGQP